MKSIVFPHQRSGLGNLALLSLAGWIALFVVGREKYHNMISAHEKEHPKQQIGVLPESIFRQTTTQPFSGPKRKNGRAMGIDVKPKMLEEFCKLFV